MGHSTALRVAIGAAQFVTDVGRRILRRLVEYAQAKANAVPQRARRNGRRVGRCPMLRSARARGRLRRRETPRRRRHLHAQSGDEANRQDGPNAAQSFTPLTEQKPAEAAVTKRFEHRVMYMAISPSGKSLASSGSHTDDKCPGLPQF